MPAWLSFTTHKPVASASPNCKICWSEWFGSIWCPYSYSHLLASVSLTKLRTAALRPGRLPFWRCEAPGCCFTRKYISTAIPPTTKFCFTYCLFTSCIPTATLRFNEGRESVHDDPQSGRPSVVNGVSVRAVEENIQENWRLTFPAFSTNVTFTSSRNCVW